MHAPDAESRAATRPLLPRWRTLARLAAFLALWTLTACLSCRLMLFRATDLPGIPAFSAAGALLGESRVALGAWLYEKADEYFHKGVRHLRPEAFSNSPYQRLQRLMVPRSHVHLAGGGIAEIMPWLRLATRADPGRIETYLVAAFWLASEAHRPDAALEILLEAQTRIPRSDLLQLEKGRLHLRAGHTPEARQAFDAGLAFWPGQAAPQSEEARHTKAALLFYHGLLHEADGHVRQAVDAYAEIISLYPQRAAVRERLETLRRGHSPQLNPAQTWKEKLRDDDHARRRAACPEKHEAGADESRPKHDHRAGPRPPSGV